MTTKENAINWFEISVGDINRAKKFYESIFGISMEVQNNMGMDMSYFPFDMGNGKVSGALVQGHMHKPSTDGVKLYLNANPDLANALGKVEAAGGKITMPKTKISDDIGHMAFFMDTEGNVIALHSQN
ncbi:MAG: VOC family protein [Flavobacteriales bacterium]|nr:VOC family protein [Flavobacteriales bacterium]